MAEQYHCSAGHANTNNAAAHIIPTFVQHKECAKRYIPLMSSSFLKSSLVTRLPSFLKRPRKCRPLAKSYILLLLRLLGTSIELVYTKIALLSLVHVGQTCSVNSLKTNVLTKVSGLVHDLHKAFSWLAHDLLYKTYHNHL